MPNPTTAAEWETLARLCWGTAFNTALDKPLSSANLDEVWQDRLSIRERDLWRAVAVAVDAYARQQVEAALTAHRGVVRRLATRLEKLHVEDNGHPVSECPEDCVTRQMLTAPLVQRAREEKGAGCDA